MPSSTYHVLNKAIENILKTQPKSILEIGIGFGKYGFLAREYLETWNDRVFPETWTTRIVGVEIFEPYTQLPWMDTIYDKIYAQPVSQIVPEIFDHASFDMAIAMDVMEHMPKDEALGVCKDLIINVKKVTMINVPTGDWMNNVVVANNPAEQHQAIWEPEDFDKLSEETGIRHEKIIWQQGARKGCLAIFKK